MNVDGHVQVTGPELHVDNAIREIMTRIRQRVCIGYYVVITFATNRCSIECRANPNPNRNRPSQSRCLGSSTRSY
jgi:hypothetical protein